MCFLFSYPPQGHTTFPNENPNINPAKRSYSDAFNSQLSPSNKAIKIENEPEFKPKLENQFVNQRSTSPKSMTNNNNPDEKAWRPW